MRKPFALLGAAALIAVVVAWWTIGEGAVSVVPGWHTLILAPYALGAAVVSAALLAIAFATLFRHLGGRKRTR